ncbi:hypothetical protein CTAYLR_004057 [Chrysophaeum taylorii]|uniref:Uncharacterized protein n=1 Tax=Chrysophaeum taylorii TaxID=2483200 RepID=A0AAD7XRE2_9STRA|nr:hypothetical protein CTAYLR_004057 [Chrysophaeum taylorii]
MFLALPTALLLLAPAPPPRQRVLEGLSSQFAWVVAGAAAAGWAWPHAVSTHVLAGQPSVSNALSVAMFCAGAGLSRNDITSALVRRPRALLGGVCAQYTVMPSLAKAASLCVQSHPDVAAGMLLVGCCPGGAASNVVTLVAKGDVGLSIAMTATSTLCAGLATPALARRLGYGLGAVEIPSRLLYRPMLQTLVVPTLLGVAFNETAPPKPAALVKAVAPAVSSVLIAAIVSRVVADARLAPALTAALTARVALSLLALHASGFALGYVVASYVLRIQDPPSRRAISIEVGMQNSALAAVLAASLFPHDLAAASRAALPGGLSACCHSLLGGALASYWRRRRPPFANE